MKQIVNASGYVRIGSDTAVPTNIAASATPVTILPANPNRAHVSIDNNSTSILYLLWQSGAYTVSPTLYTARMVAGAFYEMPGDFLWFGSITGIWASAAGFAAVTEAS